MPIIVTKTAMPVIKSENAFVSRFKFSLKEKNAIVPAESDINIFVKYVKVSFERSVKYFCLSDNIFNRSN